MTYSNIFLERGSEKFLELLILLGIVVAVVVCIVAIVFLKLRQKNNEELHETAKQFFQLAAEENRLPDKFLLNDRQFICGENVSTSSIKEAGVSFQYSESPQVKIDLKDQCENKT